MGWTTDQLGRILSINSTISLSILKSVDNLSARTVCHDQKVDKVEDFGPETKVENVGWRMYDMGMTCMIYRFLYFILISANWSWAGANCANPDLAFISISYPTLDNWEKEINNTPCISVTHSKSLCDTLTKFWNTTQQHIWKIKRTKCDFQKRGGQVRWIEGTGC